MRAVSRDVVEHVGSEGVAGGEVSGRVSWMEGQELRLSMGACGVSISATVSCGCCVGMSHI